MIEIVAASDCPKRQGALKNCSFTSAASVDYLGIRGFISTTVVSGLDWSRVSVESPASDRVVFS